MNNKICNPKVEVPCTINMNDKDYLNTVLNTEKALVKAYAVALTEASNNDLYNDYLDMFNDISDAQRSTFELSFNKGWYTLEEAESTKIDEKYTLLQQQLNEITDND